MGIDSKRTDVMILQMDKRHALLTETPESFRLSARFLTVGKFVSHAKECI